jgi:phage terminase large subunit
MIEKPTLIIDPSAASFIAVVNKRKQFKVRKADNEVIDGIRRTASALKNRRILFNDCCVNTISEFGEYAWDDKATEDTVIKEHDHAMDAVRYFVMTERIYNDKER